MMIWLWRNKFMRFLMVAALISLSSVAMAKSGPKEDKAMTESQAREQCNSELNITTNTKISAGMADMRRDCINKKIGK